MNDTKFFALDFEQQMQTLHQYGRKLMTRDHSIYRINLYSLFDFFIEAWLLPGHNHIENIELIDAGDIIDLYPINLHLEDIFSNN